MYVMYFAGETIKNALDDGRSVKTYCQCVGERGFSRSLCNSLCNGDHALCRSPPRCPDQTSIDIHIALLHLDYVLQSLVINLTSGILGPHRTIAMATLGVTAQG